MKTAAMTTMMAGPMTVGLGCFSPVQRLDERSEASTCKGDASLLFCMRLELFAETDEVGTYTIL